MANAEVTTQPAPLTKETVAGAATPKSKTKEQIALEQVFDADKKYMFELAQTNMEREHPVYDARSNRPIESKKFKPFQNIVFSSQIVWEGQRRNIRYYDGCTSLFVDDQPKDKETVDQLIKQTKKRHFQDGKFGCFGDERMLLLYLNICSWNADSDFRTRSADAIFRSVNADKKASEESNRLDQTEKALELAKSATDMKMRIHANYLGIPTTDWESGNGLSDKEIRISYRQEALRNPERFITSHGDKTLEIKYYIEQALEKGIINNKLNPNKAAWSTSNTAICDISGLKSPVAIAEKLLEFSQLEEGQEFVIQLKSVINK
jgi:hypothetical protein